MTSVRDNNDDANGLGGCGISCNGYGNVQRETEGGGKWLERRRRERGQRL